MCVIRTYDDIPGVCTRVCFVQVVDFFVQAPNHGIIPGGSHVFRARKPHPGPPLEAPSRQRPVRATSVQRHTIQHTVQGDAAVTAQPGHETMTARDPGGEQKGNNHFTHNNSIEQPSNEDAADADRRRFAQQFGEQAAEQAAREVEQHKALRVGELGAQYEREDGVGLRAGAGHHVDVHRGAWDPDNQAVEYDVVVLLLCAGISRLA